MIHAVILYIIHAMDAVFFPLQGIFWEIDGNTQLSYPSHCTTVIEHLTSMRFCLQISNISVPISMSIRGLECLFIT